jgi:hypothetical protein
MPLTREQFIERRNALQFDLEQLRQQFLAVSGAIADIDYWLAQLEPPTPPLEVETTPKE